MLFRMERMMTNKTVYLLGILILGFLMQGCGVRGRPQPPTTPPEIGRGQPTFRRATEQLAFPTVAPVPTPGPDVEEGQKSK